MGTVSPLTIHFIGDLYSGGEYELYRKKHGIQFSHSFGNVISSIESPDLFVVNFEGPVYRIGQKRTGVTCHLHNDLEILTFLKQKGNCILNLGNNHIMDHGPESLEKTLKVLQDNDIPYFGAGITRENAWKELIVHYNGRRIAFLGFSTDERNVKTVIAGTTTPGCASFLEKERVINKITDLKARADIIIISLHWGFEYHHFPSYEQQEFAHSLADAGAHIIYGHHPHVIQGIETYKKSLIMYSLGNFFFPPVRNTMGRLQYQKSATKEFIIVETVIDEKNQIRYTYKSGNMKRKYVLCPHKKRKQRKFDRRMDYYSGQLTHNHYKVFWKQYRKARKKNLARENIIEALLKLLTMPSGDYLLTFKPMDIIKNIRRLLKVIRK